MTEPIFRSRLDSVDALRGATIAGMILVNNPGTWSAVYPPLLHAEFNGWTYTDTIFPFFLFVSGAAMTLSFSRRIDEGARRPDLLRHLAMRAAILVALGLALNAVGALAFGRAHLRFPGILQRIGVCALVGGAVYLVGGVRAAAWASGVLLVGYWPLLESGPLDPESNLAARVDRAVFGPHTWKPAFDPEGLLSTLPAIATMLLGVLAGELLRSRGGTGRRAARLAGAGAASAAAGLLWGRVFPINKTLWTSSYALLMSGLAAVALGAFVGLLDARPEGPAPWASPLLWLGRNAIAAFTLSTLGAIGLLCVRVDDPAAPGGNRSLWSAIYRAGFDRFADPRLGSLLFALSYLALWTLVFGVLYRKRVFIKI